jgi:serine protease Do
MTAGTRLVMALLLAAIAVSVADAREYAWLGVRIRDLSEQEMEELSARHGVREGFGVVIVEVMEGTPAARGGMKNGDVVVALDGRPVTESRLLQRLVAGAAIDREVPLTVLRPGGRQRLVVRPAAMPKPVVGERVAAELGCALRGGDGPLRGDGAGGGAPTVSAVMRGSAAERAGLEIGDVLLEVDGRPLIARDAAREALAESGAGVALRLVVRRGAERRTLTVHPE